MCLVVLFVGWVVYEKNIGFLFEVLVYIWCLCFDVFFVVVGEGLVMGDLKVKVKVLGLYDVV